MVLNRHASPPHGRTRQRRMGMQKRLDAPFAHYFHPAKGAGTCCCMWSMSMPRKLADVRDQGRHISLPYTAGSTDTRLNAVDRPQSYSDTVGGRGSIVCMHLSEMTRCPDKSNYTRKTSP